MKKRNIRKWCVIGGILVAATVLMCDMRLKTVHYQVTTEKVNQTIRIALVTDLHSDFYGKNQKNLIRAIEKENPDVVLLGGDIFDDKKSYENSKMAIRQFAEKYPCYYVTGNHEYWGNDVDTILNIVEECGIQRLSGECEQLEIKGETIGICGVDDPDVLYYTEDGIAIEEQLSQAETAANLENFTVLLSHRPELTELYNTYQFDLVLSGHAHGGQWRIPGILNGLYAPHQGLFPECAGGRYEFDTQTFIVSRGLARESTLVPRIFNRPELVIVDVVAK